jgi:hypothetical protein
VVLDLISLASIEFFAQLKTLFRVWRRGGWRRFQHHIAIAASANLRISISVFFHRFAVAGAKALEYADAGNAFSSLMPRIEVDSFKYSA